MSILNLSLACVLLVTAGTLPARNHQPAQTPPWRQIELLHSTRADVEKLLGHPEKSGYLVRYPLKEGSLEIDYYVFDYCVPVNGGNGGWNVPRWTVTEITYNPFKKPPRFSSLGLDLEKFRKVRESPDVIDLISYVNDEEGVSYTVEPDGTLNSIRYFPSSHHENLRCPEPSAEQP